MTTSGLLPGGGVDVVTCFAGGVLSNPTVIVVSGPPGSGKTTLAHALARSIGCPAICRDEIKEGMAHASLSDNPAASDDLNQRTLATFFQVIELLVRAEVTVVVEAAFQDRLWRPGLTPLREIARIRVVHCSVPAHLALARRRRRIAETASRQAHEAALPDPAAAAVDHDTFLAVALPDPSITVDTTNGYTPDLATIVAFANDR